MKCAQENGVLLSRNAFLWFEEVFVARESNILHFWLRFFHEHHQTLVNAERICLDFPSFLDALTVYLSYLRFSPTCFLDKDGLPTCDACYEGYKGRNCEL